MLSEDQSKKFQYKNVGTKIIFWLKNVTYDDISKEFTSLL